MKANKAFTTLKRRLGTAQGQFAENFVGFAEMDYLGKIYNYYTFIVLFSFYCSL